MIKQIWVVCILVILSIFSGCENNSPLVIGIVPSSTPEELRERFEPLRQYLEMEINVPIEVNVPSDYADLIEAMKEEKVDIGLFGPFSYIIADNQQELEPLVVRERKDLGVTYNSLLISRKNSGITSIEDMEGKRMAFVNPASTSGYIIPFALFTSRKIDIESYFAEYTFIGSHDLVVEAVLRGEVDTGAVSKSILINMINNGELEEDDLQILWESDPIPGSPFVARKNIKTKYKRGFTQAMLQIHEKAPDVLSPSLSRYVTIEEGMYNPIRNIIAILGEDFIKKNYLDK